MGLVAIDCETGGLDASKCALLSIGAAQMDDELRVVSTFQAFVRPEYGLLIEEKAIAVNGYSMTEWDKKGAVPLKDALLNLQAWMPARRDMLAHNASFDKGFLEAAEKRAQMPLYLGYAWECSMATFKASTRAFALNHTKSNLDYAARAVGHWKPDFARGSHDALEDALASAAIYRWCINRMRDGQPGQRTLAL